MDSQTVIWGGNNDRIPAMLLSETPETISVPQERGLMNHGRILRKMFPVAVTLGCAAFLSAWQEPPLSEGQIKEFLRTAQVVAKKNTSKGITSPYRLTLTDGTITHDAGFNYVAESSPRKVFADGHVEIDFKDNYKYDIAAYELAKLLGLGDMMPVTVERKYDDKWGAISWWLPVKMDESTRMKNSIQPPDPDAFNRQIYKKRIFAELVYDTDQNLTNVLISEDWHVWMIDFTRAFRLNKDLYSRKNITESKCERRLLEKLRGLDRNELVANTRYNGREYLSRGEIDGVMARRNKIVAIFTDLIAKKGEKEVLYDDPIAK